MLYDAPKTGFIKHPCDGLPIEKAHPDPRAYTARDEDANTIAPICVLEARQEWAEHLPKDLCHGGE